jgi:hypothetical protein
MNLFVEVVIVLPKIEVTSTAKVPSFGFPVMRAAFNSLNWLWLGTHS